MKHYRNALLAALIGFGLSSSVGAADNSPWSPGEAWASQQLRYLARPGKSLDEVRKRFAYLFLQSDINGGGISQSDYDEQIKILLAQKRARAVSNILRKDLNGDGIVNMDELKAFHLTRARRPIRANGVQLEPTEQQIELMLTQLVKKDLDFDGDGDGAITYPEMLAAAQAISDRQMPYLRKNRRNVPLEMDQDGDGTVTRQEFDQVIDRLLAKADADGDGYFSRQEVDLIKRRAIDFMRMQRDARRAKKI